MIIKGIYWHKTAHSESQLKGREQFCEINKEFINGFYLF
ncbi:MAG: hypothetical protein BWY41_01148 [Candidatus Atribacteria bacterium ADurb.Bin276]|jgi:hypothetical protein|uniref:Uncharacterized protein n=1 Tax=Candidatus Atribacter allofermentans TaxID=1852833 RepID=A0A1V5SU53_9BACT|nr:MAG: hypothetical protein BWY41_01148 [Candidatus Atribacteria bacterium ADurb.Bin276]